MRIFIRLLQLLGILLTVAFTLLNADKVLVNFLIGKAEVPLAVVALISLGVGFLLAVLVLLGPLLHQRYQSHILQRKVTKMEQKLLDLRNNT